MFIAIMLIQAFFLGMISVVGNSSQNLKDY